MRGTRVFVGRLPYQARERDVERFFKGYGRIHEVLLKNGYGFVEFDDPRDADDAVYELNGKTLCGERVTIEHARGPSRGIRGNDRGGRGSRGRRDDYGRNNDRGRHGGGSYGGDRGGGGSSSRDRYRGSSRDRPSGSRTNDGRPGWEEKYGPTERTEWRLRVENLSTRVRWQDLKDYMRQAGDVTYTAAHNNEPNEGIVEFSSKKDMTNAYEKLNGTEMNGRKLKLVIEEVTLPFKQSSNSRRSYSRSRSKSRSASRSRSRSPRRSRSRSSHSRSKSSRSASRSPVNGKHSDGGNDH